MSASYDAQTGSPSGRWLSERDPSNAGVLRIRMHTAKQSTHEEARVAEAATDPKLCDCVEPAPVAAEDGDFAVEHCVVWHDAASDPSDGKDDTMSFPHRSRNRAFAWLFGTRTSAANQRVTDPVL